MAYWQNGKVYVHTGTQSTAQTVPAIGRWLGIDPANVVFISEYTGGGFGSKITGDITLVIPALLAKKTGAPVMMRITREEENYIGRARPSLHGRMKVGFAKDGRITGPRYVSVICDNGPYDMVGDAFSSGRIVSVLYQPQAMPLALRLVGPDEHASLAASQSSPGGMRRNRAHGTGPGESGAKARAVDQVAIRRINCPPKARRRSGPAREPGKQQYATSAFIKEALDRGARSSSSWNERKVGTGNSGMDRKHAASAYRSSTYSGGSTGFDGLFVIKPDGRMYIQ